MVETDLAWLFSDTHFGRSKGRQSRDLWHQVQQMSMITIWHQLHVTVYSQLTYDINDINFKDDVQ